MQIQWQEQRILASYFFLDFVALDFFVDFCATAGGFVGAARKRLAGGSCTIFSTSTEAFITVDVPWRFLRVEGLSTNSWWFWWQLVSAQVKLKDLRQRRPLPAPVPCLDGEDLLPLPPPSPHCRFPQCPSPCSSLLHLASVSLGHRYRVLSYSCLERGKDQLVADDCRQGCVCELLLVGHVERQCGLLEGGVCVLEHSGLISSSVWMLHEDQIPAWEKVVSH